MTSKLKLVSLPELFDPPDDTTFEGGIWATHDLDGSVLSDIVIPTLTKVTTRNPHRRRIESRKSFAELDNNFTDFGLTILAAAGATHRPGPSLPSSVHVVEVKGRRQHAKFGVLWFRESANVCITRVVITSANLTRSGLSSNFEICWSRDFETARTGKSIVSFLLAQSQLMIEESGHEKALALIKNQRRWRHGRTPSPAERVRQPKSIYSTLSNPTTASKSRALLKPDTFKNSDELIIVSPAFQGDRSTTAARSIANWAKGSEHTHIYTQATPNGSLYFSKAIIRAAEMACPSVTLHAVSSSADQPTNSDNPTTLPPQRALHAKMFASTTGTRARVLIGSANLTDRALSGRNRELMIEIDLPVKEFRRFIKDLPSIEVAKADVIEAPPIEHEEDESPGSLSAEFEIEVGSASATRWRGRLQLQLASSQKPSKIEYLGEALKPKFDKNGHAAVDGFKLTESLAALDVHWPNGVKSRVPIIVNAPEDQSGFWGRITAEGQRARGDGLLALLADIDRAVSLSEGITPNQNKAKTSERDGYSTPLDNRLIELVRARHRLHVDVDGKQMLTALERYFDGVGSAELECAQAVLGAFHPDIEAPDNPLLDAFARAAKSFQTDEDE